LATGRKRGGAYRFLKNIAVNRRALMGITGKNCLIFQEQPKLIILILTWLSLGFTVWGVARGGKYALSLD
jgi:hypothetical protein